MFLVVFVGLPPGRLCFSRVGWLAALRVMFLVVLVGLPPGGYCF